MWPATPQPPPTSMCTPTDIHTYTSTFCIYTLTHTDSHHSDEQIIMSLAGVRSRQWLICQHPSRYLCSWLARRLAENHFVSSVIAWLSHHLPTNENTQQILLPDNHCWWSGILMNRWLHKDKVRVHYLEIWTHWVFFVFLHWAEFLNTSPMALFQRAP